MSVNNKNEEGEKELFWGKSRRMKMQKNFIQMQKDY